LPELDGFIAKRTALAKRYLEILAGWPEFTLPGLPAFPHKHSWHLFTVRLQNNTPGLNRDEFMNAMKSENIGIGLHYQSAHTFSWYKERYGWKPQDFPHALTAGNTIMSLPLFPTLTEAEQDRMIKAMSKVLKR